MINLEDRTRGLVVGPPVLITPVSQVARLNKSKVGDWFLSDLITPEWKPVRVHWKLVVKAREGGEILWMRPFASYNEALAMYVRMIGLNVDWAPSVFRLPSTWVEQDIEIQIATVATYNSTNTTNADWPTGNKCPTGITQTDYLFIAGGGSGGAFSNPTGGGGAGGLLQGTAYSVTAGTQYTITVGAGGASSGANGNNSVWDTNTATGGGVGSGYTHADPGNGGSGGGGDPRNGSTNTGGTGTVGQGHDGGSGAEDAGHTQAGGGSGGGSGSAATNSTQTQVGAGGSGTSSSISGSAVTYASGGTGAAFGTGVTGATAPAGGGGSGGVVAGATGGSGSSVGGSGTANTGGGGGGSGGTAGAGGSGVIILSFSSDTLMGQIIM